MRQGEGPADQSWLLRDYRALRNREKYFRHPLDLH